MASSAPVCSPTLIICTTMGGIRPVSMSGVDMSLPSEMRARTNMMPSCTTTLPAVLPTISMASRMGTPEESSVPMVRVKRATTVLRKTWPKMGSLSSIASQASRPLRVRRIERQAMKSSDQAADR